MIDYVIFIVVAILFLGLDIWCYEDIRFAEDKSTVMQNRPLMGMSGALAVVACCLWVYYTTPPWSEVVFVAVISLVLTAAFIALLNWIRPVYKVWLPDSRALFLKKPRITYLDIINSRVGSLMIEFSRPINETEFESTAEQIYGAIEKAVKHCRAWPYGSKYHLMYVYKNGNPAMISGIWLTPLKYVKLKA